MVKEFYKEFLKLENFIFEKGYKGWTSWTKIDFPKVMLMMAKQGAKPYYLDPITREIYFSKKKVNK